MLLLNNCRIARLGSCRQCGVTGNHPERRANERLVVHIGKESSLNKHGAKSERQKRQNRPSTRHGDLGDWRLSSTHSQPWYKMEAIGQSHA